MTDQTDEKLLAAWEAHHPADLGGLRYWLKFFASLYSVAKTPRDRRFCASQQLDLLRKFAEGLCGDGDQLKPLRELNLALQAVDEGYRPELFQPLWGARSSHLAEIPVWTRLAAATEIYFSSKEEPNLEEAAKRTRKKAKANVDHKEILRWRQQFKQGDPENDLGANLYQFHLKQSLHVVPGPGALAKYADDLAESARRLRSEDFIKQ
jgi:hypothetical protein